MIPNNNFSVLPWYSSIEEQNARKWWAYGRIYPLFTPAMFMLPFQIMREHRIGATITQFRVYKKDGTLVGNYTQQLNEAGVYFKTFEDYDVIVFPGRFPVFTAFDDGQYYATISDGAQTWYSEIFTVVQDLSDYLKIQWWDNEDFIMDEGVIVYKNPSFRNTLYLVADLAKPEYVFEEEGEQRDGYFFPTKQISEKKFKFQFLASEYLLDVMRFIRMSDYAFITYRGREYHLDTFLLTPEWEGDGDIANVEAEFDTDTVAKKLGRGYIQGSGDFNARDFNSNDFNTR